MRLEGAVHWPHGEDGLAGAQWNPISWRGISALWVALEWPYPIPNTEGWPDDEGAWELRDQRTRDPGQLAPQGVCTWPVLFTCLLFLPSQKQFDSPECDGLHRAQLRAASIVMCYRADVTIWAAKPPKISVQYILESIWSVNISENLNLSGRPPFHDLRAHVNISLKFLD